MRYRRLGSTGLLVSELCFGAMTFGDSPWKLGGVDQQTADRMVGRCLEAGINCFDTADIYSDGASEEILGRSLGGRRGEVVLATKVFGRMGSGPNDQGLSRRHVLAAAEDSLRRLGTEWIDLYQVHGFDPLTPLEETLGALDDLVHAGKVRYIGLSNFAAWQIMKALAISDGHGWSRFVSAQMHYSLLGRDIEEEVVPLALDQGLGILCWSPLSGGFLSGKYRSGETPPGTRFGDRQLWFPPFDRELGFRVLQAVEEIAVEAGATPAQVSLAWLLTRDGVASVILGARRLEQLEDNLRAAELTLAPEQVARLEELTRPAARYPRWMLERQSAGRTTGPVS